MADLLRPVAKVINIALDFLQRLIALRAVSLSTTPAIIQTINNCMSQGIDVQLKILDTPLPHHQLPTIHGRLLSNVMCFRSVLSLLFLGETDAGEPRLWVQGNEGARNGDHARVRPPLYLISGTGLPVTTRSSIRI